MLADGSRFGPRIEALVVYNSNPVAVAPQSGKVVAGLRARRPVHGRARALHDRHRRPRRLRAAGDDPARAPRPARQLRPHLRADQRGGDRAARRGPAQHRRSSATLAATMGFDEPCFADERRGAGARSPSSRRRAAASTSPTCARAAGRKLPIAEAPFADGGFPTPERQVPDRRARASASPTTCRTTNRPRARPELAARYPLAMISPPARNFLNSTFVNVASLRGIEGEPVLEIAPRRRRGARHRRRRRRCASSTTAASIVCQRRGRARAPGRASSTAWACGGASSAPDGRNVNELTHQRLTDIGRAPSFYDCLVEVEPATAHRPR